MLEFDTYKLMSTGFVASAFATSFFNFLNMATKVNEEKGGKMDSLVMFNFLMYSSSLSAVAASAALIMKNMIGKDGPASAIDAFSKVSSLHGIALSAASVTIIGILSANIHAYNSASSGVQREHKTLYNASVVATTFAVLSAIGGVAGSVYKSDVGGIQGRFN